MSETNNTLVDDDVFSAFVAKATADEENSKKSTGNSFTREYEDVKWVGLEDNQFKVIRIVGAPPASMTGRANSPTDAQEIYFSTILDDNNKKMQLKLPPHAEDLAHEHIMWRIINAVKEVDWRKNEATGKKEKYFKYEGKYPWFDRVHHGGFDPKNDEFLYKINKGWQGQEVVIMNVIDREDNWCVENKHTKLLSKKVSLSKDGTAEFPAVGVPSYGFISQLANLVGRYRSWENYDLAIRRTGQMQSPYEIKPATIFAKAGLAEVEIGADKVPFVSRNETLTEEEKTWKRYEISKLYAPTTYTKILNHLGNTIKAIDADLRRNFYEELQGLAEKEKKEFEEKYGTQSSAAPTETVEAPAVTPSFTTLNESAPATPVVETPVTAPVVESATVASPVTPSPVARTITNPVVAAALSAEKIALLHGWKDLTQEERDQIVDVEVDPVENKVLSVKYSENSATTVKCIDAQGAGCGLFSPSDFLHCPVCGASYQ